MAPFSPCCQIAPTESLLSGQTLPNFPATWASHQFHLGSRCSENEPALLPPVNRAYNSTLHRMMFKTVPWTTIGLNLKRKKVSHHIVCVNCRRNQNFLDILSGLNLGQKGVFGITHQFHHVFWFGDLNYRIELDVKVRAESIICGPISTHKFLKELVENIW